MKTLNDFFLIFPFFIVFMFFLQGMVLLIMDFLAILLAGQGLEPLVRIEYVICFGFAAIIATRLHSKKI